MNKNLPYLISISSFPANALPGMGRYLTSLVHNITPGTFELILFGFAPHEFTPITDDLRFCRKYMVQDAYPGNLHRFDSLNELLETGEMDPERWIIFTDSFDVMFQKDFPDFSVFNRNEVLVADEGEKWSENSWFPTLQEQIKKVNFMKELADYNVLNAGTWAMTGEMFQVMYRYMIKRSKKYDDHQFSDQAMFNEFMYGGIPTILKHPTFCTVLYRNMELKNTIKKDNLFYNQNDELYSIVHGNGNSKEYFNDETKK